jgi:hypothetical protein
MQTGVFEVLIVVMMLIVVLWVVELCDLTAGYQCLGEKHHIHLQSFTSTWSQLMGVFCFNFLSCLWYLPLLYMG